MSQICGTKNAKYLLALAKCMHTPLSLSSSSVKLCSADLWMFSNKSVLSDSGDSISEGYISMPAACASVDVAGMDGGR